MNSHSRYWSTNPSRKRAAVYLQPELVAEMRSEAQRLHRSVSWVAQMAVKLALPVMRKWPAAPSVRLRGGQ